MTKPAKTNAARLLDAAGVAYEIRSYDLTMDDFSAEAVADDIGLPSNVVFKTLVANVDAIGPCFAVVPANRELDLKALAKAAGGRKATMERIERLQSLTGYQRGAVTVLGAKKPLPVIVDDSIRDLATVAVSAGARSLQLILAADDYVKATDAAIAPIGRVR
jgi:Cys-tRNA(Pro)/Cys-tRNA(Cys) deacylase